MSFGVSATDYRNGVSHADLEPHTPTEGDPTMPKSLVSGRAWQLGRQLAKGNAYSDTDVDRIADTAHLNDADRTRLRNDVASVTRAAGTDGAPQAGADFAERWHDRLENSDPHAREMDPAKLAALGTNPRW